MSRIWLFSISCLTEYVGNRSRCPISVSFNAVSDLLDVVPWLSQSLLHFNSRSVFVTSYYSPSGLCYILTVSQTSKLQTSSLCCTSTFVRFSRLALWPTKSMLHFKSLTNLPNVILRSLRSMLHFNNVTARLDNVVVQFCHKFPVFILHVRSFQATVSNSWTKFF